MVKSLGRAATADETRLCEAAFVERFVPADLRGKAAACFAHRTRPRQKYRDEWSGFVCHMTMVDRGAWHELSAGTSAADELLAWAGPFYLMSATAGLDRRVVTAAELRAALAAVRRLPELIAFAVDGCRALWHGEHGVFVPA